MLNLQESPESPERESRERDVIIGLDLAAAAGVDKACAIFPHLLMSKEVADKATLSWDTCLF